MLLAAAACHLLLVACGALRIVPFAEDHLWGRIVETYRACSGADNSYGFYAPAVSSEWRVVFDIHDTAKQRWTEASEKPGDTEFYLLLSTINELFAQEGLRDLLAASWAGDVFAHHPEADIVLVEPQVYLVPKMAEYRLGRKARWRTVLVFAFTRADVAQGGVARKQV